MEPLAFTSILRPEGLWSGWGKFLGNGFFELLGFGMGQPAKDKGAHTLLVLKPS
jgi:hypothetical protein